MGAECDQMLVIKVYATKSVAIPAGDVWKEGVKLEKIDEIHIQNIGQVAGDVWKYKIKKPGGIDAQITHPKSDGYRPLLERALALLEHKGNKRRKKGG